MKRFIFLCIASALLAACHESAENVYHKSSEWKESSNSAGIYYEGFGNNSDGAYEPDIVYNGVGKSEKDKIGDNKQVASETKLIKEGSITIETDQIKETETMIRNLTASLNGYISSESTYNYSTSHELSMTIRIPSSLFDSLLIALEKGAGSFTNKNIYIEDVTAQYIDLTTRLKTKREVEETYLGILKKAKNVEEILAVERELGYVRTEIESMEGQLNYLNDRIGMSTLSITVYQYHTTQQKGFFSKVVSNLIDGWQSITYTFLDLIEIWPYLLILFACIFFLRRWWRKRREKRVSNT